MPNHSRPIASRPGNLEILERFRSKTVLMVGDLVADEFVHCEISRVSREAPVLIIKHRETKIVPGGGGNAANNIAALGARVLPVGIVGNDAPGRALLDYFRARGVDTRGIVMAREFQTVTKSRILAGIGHGSRQQVVRIDREPSEPVSGTRYQQIERCALRFAAKADAVLVSDYGYGSATPQLAGSLKAVIGSRPITVDSRYRLGDYRGVTAATPNEAEVEEICGLGIGNDLKKLEQAGRTLIRKMDLQSLVITRGREGMAVLEPARPTVHIPIWGSDEVADVTGAGDTVIAVFATALAAGADFVQAARLANFAGGIVVMKRGTATVSHDELKQAVLAAQAQEEATTAG